jgi:hypothetical protein
MQAVYFRIWAILELLGQGINHFEWREAMSFKRFTGSIVIFGFALFMSSRSSFADDKSDVVAAVNRFLDNLGNDTLEKALAVCDSPVSIIDEFPPHEWHGPHAQIGGRR